MIQSSLRDEVFFYMRLQALKGLPKVIRHYVPDKPRSIELCAFSALRGSSLRDEFSKPCRARQQLP